MSWAGTASLSVPSGSRGRLASPVPYPLPGGLAFWVPSPLRGTSQVAKGSSGTLGEVGRPSPVFVIERAVAQAGVQFAQQFVGDQPDVWVVRLAAPPQPAVELAGAGGAADRRCRPAHVVVRQTRVAG